MINHDTLISYYIHYYETNQTHMHAQAHMCAKTHITACMHTSLFIAIQRKEAKTQNNYRQEFLM
jgi:hypothetical protein